MDNTSAVDKKIDDLTNQIIEIGKKHDIIQILENRITRVVFTNYNLFDYLVKNDWVDPEEANEPKQFVLCGIAKDHSCLTVRDRKAFKNKHFGKAFTEGGSVAFDKDEIVNGLSDVVDFLNDVLVDAYDKGFIKDKEEDDDKKS